MRRTSSAPDGGGALRAASVDTYIDMFDTIQKKLEEIFSIDIRSLALVRIGLGVIILQDLARRAFDIAIFYGDGGVLPAAYAKTFWTGVWAWSAHLIGGGDLWLLITLFVIHALVAIALLLGWHTRVATFLVWFLYISLHNANPLILQGEDVLLRIVLFVSVFLPLGAAFSVDAMRAKEPAQKSVLSGWSVAYLLQLAFMYFFVSLYKQSDAWESGAAIYYALSIDQYATTLGHWVLTNVPAEILALLTTLILVFQACALFLLFSPYRTALVRGVTAVLLMCMHLGFALCMNLGMFSAVAIAALCAFIPSEVWDWLAGRLERAGGALGRVSQSFLAQMRDSAIPQMSRTGAAISILGVAYIFYIFFWHAGNVIAGPAQYVPFGHGFEFPAKVLRLDQRWNLFAPYPYRHDGWIVVAAEKENGEMVDLFRGGATLTFERPDVIYDIYPRPRWRRYFLSLWSESSARYRVPYAQYLCRTWNESHKNGEAIKSLEMIWMLEWTPPLGESYEPVRPVSLLTWNCEANQEASGR